jgi:peptidoglycan/xylan/chitin deacetylase (PgdA/CDA1 family)
MYFNKKNNFYHGITFHLFHDDHVHKISQGSIDKDSFSKILKYLGRDNIINAEDFLIRLKENKLKSKDICITFDDGCKAQYDIALPVLENLKIKSFFFVYSSLFEGNPDLIEIYRFFRINSFKNVDEFYEIFFRKLNHDLKKFFYKEDKNINYIKEKFSYYSINDIKFRLVRDKLLIKNEYNEIMSDLMIQKKFNFKDYYDLLFLSKDNLREMNKLGHTIGLHSHTHPTTLANLSYEEQNYEYSKNIEILTNVLNDKNKTINSVSHPSGSYNDNTIKILKDLKIEIGFKNIMFLEPGRENKKINNSSLEIARQDHAQIMCDMGIK